MYNRENLKMIPHKPGIYMMKNLSGDVIYVGKAKNLSNRVRQYFLQSKTHSVKTVSLVSHIEEIETIVVESEMEALILECNLIKKFAPKYNIRLKDDKSYPHILVTTGEAYPRLLSTRQKKKDKHKYFGPFTNGFAVKKTIEALQKVYALRRCRRSVAFGKKVGRPCLNYHMGQCLAPCSGKVSQEAYQKEVDGVLGILSGKEKDLLAKLKVEMEEAAKQLDFELAAKKRDQIQGINHIVERQKINANENQDQDIIAFAVDGDLACVQVFNVRDGKMIGREHFFMEGVEALKPEEILTPFVKQYYPEKNFIPKEIILSHGLNQDESSTIEKWLSDLKGGRANIVLPQKGQKSKLTKMVEENAMLTLAQHLLEKKLKEEKKVGRLESLKSLLKLEVWPNRIEAYDISNISGTDNVGGMVVFTHGKPTPKAYRRFKIKFVEGQNDYGSMQEMIFRRIERGLKEAEAQLGEESFLPFPEIFCIDGGRTHVDAVKKILKMYPELKIEVVGLVKDKHHHLRGLIYEDEEYALDYGKPLTTFLSEISEEVHRYALGYHQSLRKKGMLASELGSIKGIGKKRQETLMRHFGDIHAIGKASLEEILKVPAMDKTSATAVYEYFIKKKEGNDR